MATCASCGADWTAGDFTLGCEECGGATLEVPCPLCGGACGRVWRRAVDDSHHAGVAHWSGRCGRADGPAAATNS
jgi:hypothetical protein